MFCELRIDNFAIIDNLELTFEPGLIIFTGETGAGKSIIIDAVETLLGGRAESSMVRSGAKRAYIEATFNISPQVRDFIYPILQNNDLLDDPDFLTLAREIRTNGRNIARVNGRTVNTGLLRQIGERLVDVHGQSEHLSLLHVRQHQNLLDRYAGVEDIFQSYSDVFHQLEGVHRALSELRRSESESARLTDLLKYQINEIEASRLQPGEEEELRAERTRLANAESLASLAQSALQSLDEGTPEAPSTIDLFGNVVDVVNDLFRTDTSLSVIKEVSQDIFEKLNDLAGELRSYSENIEFNPGRLDQVEERLNLIINLKRKYGDSISDIIAFAEQAHQQLETIINAEEKITELEAHQNRLLTELGEIGWELSLKRQRASEQLQSELENKLGELQMPGARFQVSLTHKPDLRGVPTPDGRRLSYNFSGIDHIEFLITPNPGEGLKPLVKIASGGETSRFMLAIKNVLARADNIPILIFDEIDQGIGGRVGAVVGQKLWHLARFHQVLCITHLPQLAAFGDQHFQVRKGIQNDRTITFVENLYGEARLHELALMLGEVSKGTLQSAQEMLATTIKISEGSHN